MQKVLSMGFQQRARSPGNSGRGRGIPRREKAKAKAKGHKSRSGGSFISDENTVLTSEQVANRTLNTLRNLGTQRFALSPFSEHLDRWLVSLRDVLSEFESSLGITADDQFVKERSQILSNVELDLGKRRMEEASAGEAVKSLSDNRMLLERIEEDYATATKKIEKQKDTEIKRLSVEVDGIKEELNRIARMKTGIFRAVSKKAKEQKEAEAMRRLDDAQSELTLVVQHLTVEQERLRGEHERRKQSVIKQIRDDEKEIEDQEIDYSLQARGAACEALVKAVNSFLQRKGL
jgi:hypothetical protein